MENLFEQIVSEAFQFMLPELAQDVITNYKKEHAIKAFEKDRKEVEKHLANSFFQTTLLSVLLRKMSSKNEESCINAQLDKFVESKITDVLLKKHLSLFHEKTEYSSNTIVKKIMDSILQRGVLDIFMNQFED